MAKNFRGGSLDSEAGFPEGLSGTNPVGPEFTRVNQLPLQYGAA
jgi:hypothetical protein